MSVVAIATLQLLSLAAFIVLWLATTRIGNGAKRKFGLSYYHWFMLANAFACLLLGLSFSKCAEDKYLPQDVKNSVHETKEKLQKSEGWKAFDEFLGRERGDEPRGWFEGPKKKSDDVPTANQDYEGSFPMIGLRGRRTWTYGGAFGRLHRQQKPKLDRRAADD
jgi:hypothetical protein